MRRLILTPLLAATLALSPVAPAQAQLTNEQVNQIILGLVTIGAAGIAIDKLKDRRDDDRKKKKKRHGSVGDHRDRYRDHYRDRDIGYDRHRRVLPARCAALVEGRDGNARRVLGKRCLERNMRGIHRLPGHCQRNVYAFGRERTVYGQRCLSKYGWTVARHR